MVVRVRDVEVPVQRDRDAAGRVEKCGHRRAVVASNPLSGADDDLGNRRLAQHERARAERENHQDEDNRAPQPVHAQDRRGDERRPRGTGAQHRHAAVC